MKNQMLLFGLGLLLAAVAPKAQPTFKGNASYYSDRLHGRTMSNGERYNKDSMTCAHLTLPLGTMLKVRNPLNGREVIVKVTDRGPHTKRFIIDLSRAAARELDIIQAGFSLVEITVYHPGVVPFRLEPEDDTPVLYLEYLPYVTYPIPVWQDVPPKKTPPAPAGPKKSRKKAVRPMVADTTARRTAPAEAPDGSGKTKDGR